MKAAQKKKLVEIAAKLLTNTLSDNEEDYPKSMPKYILKEIAIHNDFLQRLRIQISLILKDQNDNT